jgi:hypothetical protein
MSGGVGRREGDGRLGLSRFLAPSPSIMATGMEMQHDGRAIEQGLDLVLNISRADNHATEVARRRAAFTAPHANRDGTSQGSHVQPSSPWLPRGRNFVRRC